MHIYPEAGGDQRAPGHQGPAQGSIHLRMIGQTINLLLEASRYKTDLLEHTIVSILVIVAQGPTPESAKESFP